MQRKYALALTGFCLCTLSTEVLADTYQFQITNSLSIQTATQYSMAKTTAGSAPAIPQLAANGTQTFSIQTAPRAMLQIRYGYDADNFCQFNIQTGPKGGVSKAYKPFAQSSNPNGLSCTVSLSEGTKTILATIRYGSTFAYPCVNTQSELCSPSGASKYDTPTATNNPDFKFHVLTPWIANQNQPSLIRLTPGQGVSVNDQYNTSQLLSCSFDRICRNSNKVYICSFALITPSYPSSYTLINENRYPVVIGGNC